MTNKQYSITANGLQVIKNFIKILPAKPGVYRMLDNNGKVLYVGKAKNLPNRVVSYTQLNNLRTRLKFMVINTASMEFITTKTETEALILEASLIKSLKPKYNILLKDDKSFPYICIKKNHAFSQLTKHRGAKNVEGRYFGPFASARKVDNTINYIQRTFLLRSCSNNYFSSRTRPCILYQIKRCSAPCVGKISEQEYLKLEDQACKFLEGNTVELQQKLSSAMQEASEQQRYELAAIYRDRINSINSIHYKQKTYIDEHLPDGDYIAIYGELGEFCVQIFFIRGGKNYGNKSYFLAHTEGSNLSEVLSAFVLQFYQNHLPPNKIIVNIKIDEEKVIEDALSSIAESKISFRFSKNYTKYRILKLAEQNAKEALIKRNAASAEHTKLMEKLQQLFDLPFPPKRIEVYDNSHISGTDAIGAMIVFKHDGFDKHSYRIFNIKKQELSKAPLGFDDELIANSINLPKGGDDYAMLREVLTRRLTRLRKEFPEYVEGEWPDLLLIDGGKGQLSITKEVLTQLELLQINFVAIAKGPQRNAGREHFFTTHKDPFTLPKDDPVMRHLQILRDEAHRFAIKSHRLKRAKKIQASILDKIPKIGLKRKNTLLQYFGSVAKLQEASIDEINKAPSITKKVAEVIYNYLHIDK